MQGRADRTWRFPFRVVVAGAVLLVFAGLQLGSDKRPARVRPRAAAESVARTAPAESLSVAVADPGDASHEVSVRPTAELMQDAAVRIAAELWGARVRLFAMGDVYGAGGQVTSRFYAFAIGEDVPSSQEMLARIAAGEDPAQWDDTVCCLEMGASLDVPPLVARWTGVPFEWLHRAPALAALERRYPGAEFDFARIHGSAVVPVLEFRSAGKAYFYEPKSGRVACGFEMRPDEEFLRSEKHQRRVAERRAAWEAFAVRMGW